MNDSAGEKNPWLSIPAAEYELHMGSPRVLQQQYLSRIFHEVLERFRPRAVAVLGCATGNGFEHIDSRITRRVVGVDFNPEYVAVLRDRFEWRIPGLSLHCTDIAEFDLEPRSVDLVHCGLVLEYIEPAIVLRKAVQWLKPGGSFTVVLQLESAGHGHVTDTEYESLARLDSVMKLVEPADLVRVATETGFEETLTRVDLLETGKQFHVGCFLLA
jgi:SAM-dependent methyltransferase